MLGVAGVFSNSSDICELRENLFNKVDLVQPNTRWGHVNLDIPSRWGTIPEIDRCDSGFFGK